MSLRDFIKSHGYDFVPEHLDNNWQIARCNQTNRKVWYIGGETYNGHTRFSFGECADKSKVFSFSDAPLSNVVEQREFAKYKRQIEKSKERFQVELASNIERIVSEWKKNKDGTEYSAYLFNKGFGKDVPPGCVVRNDDHAKNILVVPMRDDLGKLWSIQQIFASGAKKFWAGARKKDTCFILPGENEEPGVTYVGEGFATCYAVWKHTKQTVVCAFDTGNLEWAVKMLIARRNSPIVLLADWDGETFEKQLADPKCPTAKNPGMLAVQKITQKYGINFAYPPGFEFPENQKKNWDFADSWAINLMDFTIQGPDALQGKLFEVPKNLQNVGKSAESGGKVAETNQETIEYPLNSPENFVPTDVTQNRDTNLCKVEPVDPGTGKAFPLRPRQIIRSEIDGFFVQEASGNKMIEVPQYEDFSLYMDQEHHLKVSDGFMFRYNENHYQRTSKLELRALGQRVIQRNTDPREIGRFVDHAIAGNFIDGRVSEPAGFLNLKNGILNVRTRELLEHSPEYFFKYQLPHSYDATAECPEWLKFLERTFEGKQELLDVSAEIFGYVLLGGKPFLHKAFLLSGEGRNGKSTYLDVLKYMIGWSNFSAVPMSHLDKPFSVVGLDGKLANIVGETTNKEINSEAFKTAVGGEELIAAQKNQPEYFLPVNARLIFACNKLPHLGDATTGSHEKFYILPFDRYIQPSERIPMFAQKFLFPEIGGVINWALGGLERLLKRGNLPELEAVAAQQYDLRTEIDSVFAWMQERVTLTHGPENSKIQPKNWFENYERWCVDERRTPVSPIQFSRRFMAEVRKYPNLRVTKPHNSVMIQGPIGLLVKGSNGNARADMRF